jgi:alkanesulfonate monooxygenase
MPTTGSNGVIEIFTTCPGNTSDATVERPGFYTEGGPTYLKRVIDVARWSEECGFKGILIYIDNSLIDNWKLAQVILERTERLIPLLAVQPIYMHPYWVAKQIATFGHLYGRQIALNMLAGAFPLDLKELGDTTPHDDRYKRMTEYTMAVMKLLESDQPTTYAGTYYRLQNVKMKPPLAKALKPLVLLSGASDAGMEAARTLGAVAVRYPKPVTDYEREPLERGMKFGIRLGIIAREYKEQAWAIAYRRFPEDRKGQLTHQFAEKVSDSVWHHELSAVKEGMTDGYPYWLGPFQNYKTFCPYLVGTYREVSEIVARYIQVGFTTFITDIPPDKEELFHQKIVFELASLQVRGAAPGAQVIQSGANR